MDEMTRVERFRNLTEDERIRPENLLGTMSAFAAYDAKQQASLEAGRVAATFQRAREKLGKDRAHDGMYMAALADTLECMEKQIYEHYRAVADLLLEAAQSWFQSEPKADALAVYAVLKGVRLGLLDEEKYMPPALKAFGELNTQSEAYSLVCRERGNCR